MAQNLRHLAAWREDRAAALAKALRRHRGGVTDAGRALRLATAALLKAELKTRRKAGRKAAAEPTLFAGT